MNARPLLAAALAATLATSISCSRKPACEGKLSGAASGAFTCTVMMRNSGRDFRLLLTPVRVPEGVKALSLPDLEIPLPVAPNRDYSLSTTNKARAIVTAADHRAFVAEKSKTGQRGSLDLRFTKVAVGKAHEVMNASGTLQAHLVSADNGDGEVVIDMTF